MPNKSFIYFFKTKNTLRSNLIWNINQNFHKDRLNIRGSVMYLMFSHKKKKSFMRKMSVRLLLKKVEILGAQKTPFGRPWRLNAIWCDMKIYAHLYFSPLRIFYVKMANFEREGGLHIFVTGPKFSGIHRFNLESKWFINTKKE